MHSHLRGLVRGFFLTLCLSLFAAIPLQAVSPHAGTYQGVYEVFNNDDRNGVIFSRAAIEFTIENDGTISNVVNGNTTLPGTITGTVTDPGAATFTLTNSAITAGTIANGVLNASAVTTTLGDYYQRLNATRVYGVIPVWQTTTTAGLITNQNGVTLASSPTKVVALVANGNRPDGWSLLASTDGVTWTKTSLDLQAGTALGVSASPIAYLNGRFIFHVATTTTNRIYTSTDGTAWTTTDTGLSNRKVITWNYFNGSYVGLLANFGPAELNALTSTDGTTWTVSTLVASGVAINPGSLAVSPTLALASLTTQSPSSTTLYTGTDLATTWQSSTFPDGGTFAPQGLIYGNGIFVGMGSQILLSADALTWTPSLHGAPTGTNFDNNQTPPLVSGIFANGSFYAESLNPRGLLLRSTDGHTWNRAVRPTTAFGFQLFGNIAMLNGVAVGVATTNGTDRTLVYATPDSGPGLSSVRPPTVTTEPLNLTAAIGASSGLVSAFKGNGLRTTYQWFKDGQPVAGQTNAILLLNSPTVGDTGAYTCVGTNTAGSTSTRAATLIFYDPAKSFPTLIWSTPVAITYGTALSATQLNASAVGGIAGTFTYTPAAGTILGIGTGQTLGVTFTPDNTALYNSVYKTTKISVNLPSQTITFAALGPKVTTDAPFTLAPTASSGLPVTLSVISGPATVSGYTITLTGATGTVTLRASQAGNTDYAPAAVVNRSFAVTANPTALTLTDLIQTYTGTRRPITVLGATGAVNVTYKVGLNYVPEAPINVGSYLVKVVAGAITKTGTLIINKAPLYVQPDDQRKFAGQANPVLGFSYSGFLDDDNAGNSVSKVPVIATTATATSVGGLYPITASLGTTANYLFVYLKGTMKVESFAGNYEALLVDDGPKPVGKLSITVLPTSKTFTAKLATATETSAVSFVSSNLNTVGEQATGTATTLIGTGKIPYRIDFTLPIVGNVIASATRSSLPLGSAADGRKLSTKAVAYAGAHTAVLEPATPTGSTVPAGAGWATASISTTGVLALTGKLGDGTAFTTALSPDLESNPGYRLFVQPYLAARTQSFLAGSFTLAPHPTLTGRRYLDQSSLTWKKTGLPADVSYRAGFGPVNTVMMIDPWLAPKTTAPAFTLAQRLGLTGASIIFGVAHSATGSASQSNLPTRLSLSTTNAVSVLTPSANLTKWKTLTFVPTTGTFTGSFELTDAIKRPVTFSGILRQPATNPDTLIGEGHYLLPPLTGTEKTTGEVMFTRP